METIAQTFPALVDQMQRQTRNSYWFSVLFFCLLHGHVQKKSRKGSVECLQVPALTSLRGKMCISITSTPPSLRSSRCACVLDQETEAKCARVNV